MIEPLSFGEGSAAAAMLPGRYDAAASATAPPATVRMEARRDMVGFMTSKVYQRRKEMKDYCHRGAETQSPDELKRPSIYLLIFVPINTPTMPNAQFRVEPSYSFERMTNKTAAKIQNCIIPNDGPIPFESVFVGLGLF